MTGSLENIFQLSKVARVILSSCLHQRSSTRSVYVTFTFPFGSVKDEADFEKIKNCHSHRRTGRGEGGGGGRGGLQSPQILGNSDFFGGSKRKFGQSQFLKTFPCFV